MNGSIHVLLTTLLVVSLADAPVWAQSVTSDPEAIARRADRALEEIESLRADFVQRVENPVLERTSTGRGTLLYGQGGRFRIEYTDPAGDVVVNDGEHVWIYLPSSQPGQVIRQRAEDSGVQNPLTFLRDLRGLYRITAAAQTALGGRSSDRLVLEPIDERAPYTALEVWVDRADNLPTQVQTRTLEGVVTTYTFAGFDVGAPSAGSAFVFEVPAQAEVFDQ